MSKFLCTMLASLLLTTGCAPSLRLSPKEHAVILLPDSSQTPTEGHFKYSEEAFVWLPQALAGDYPVANDVLANAAPNRAVKNVRGKTELNWGWFLLTYGGTLAASILFVAAAPQPYKSYGTLLPFAFLFMPQGYRTEVEGDFAERPVGLNGLE